MKKISELNLGFSDAENYKLRENKPFLSRVFVRTIELDHICEARTSFVIGEKGTGKTAYAVYVSNTSYKNNFSCIRYIRETDFIKFIALKKERHLDLSDYSSIWKVIIYLLVSQQIIQNERKTLGFRKLMLFSKLKAAIEEYYGRAFSPEIVNALHFIERSEIAAGLLAQHINVQGLSSEERQFSESQFQTNLLFIQRNFEDVFRSSKLSRNHVLFIDGIDIRPQSVPYSDYLACIRGLANAVWDVNTDIFSNIKDSPGRLRVVLLVRPDIFQFLGLQNQNTKFRDNSVILDWRTTEEGHRSSRLFQVIDHLLAPEDKSSRSIGVAWDRYFPSDTHNVDEGSDGPNSFVAMLKLSLHRPRDFITMLRILQEIIIDSGELGKESFSFSDIDAVGFRNKASDYLLGEVKDQILFYYSNDEYEMFLKFFEFLYGKTKFDYDEYENAFQQIIDYMSRGKHGRPQFMRSSSQFLQFLYDLNVICYIEESERGERFTRWCFRERSYSSIAPKVKTNEAYEVHYGLWRALNLGIELHRRSRARQGTLKSYDVSKGYGFIVPERGGRDVFLHRSKVSEMDVSRLVPGAKLYYETNRDEQDRMFAEKVRLWDREE